MNNLITIELNNKIHSFRFGMGAWEKFCEIQKCEFYEMYYTGIMPFPADETLGRKEIKYNPFVFKNLLFAAYLYNCEYEEKEPELNKAQSSEILDILLQNKGIREKVWELIAQSLKMDLGESKKKVTKS